MRHRVESASNRRLKATRDLGTRQGVLRQDSFLVEGPRFVSDAMESLRPSWLVLADSAGDGALQVVELAVGAGCDVLEVPDELFRGLSDTIHSQGLLAVCPLPHAEAGDIPPEGPLLLLDGLADPGNTGTLIRSAAAFGAACVVAGVGSCCPFTPKVTRAAAGLNASVPIIFDADLPVIMGSQIPGTSFIGAEAGGAPPGGAFPEEQRVGLVIGSESHGISEPVGNLLSGRVGIPMTEGVESLNAAVSGSLLLYLLSCKT